MPPAVGGDLQAVFDKCDIPANQYHFRDVDVLESEVTVPCSRHEQVAGEKYGDGGHKVCTPVHFQWGLCPFCGMVIRDR